MNYIWGKDIDAALAVGYSLAQEGILNFALDKSDALNVLNKFKDLQVAVLGGDVYSFDGIRWQSQGDSWFCEEEAGENATAFARRSIDKAREYILSYAIPGVRFALVPRKSSR